MHQLFQLQQQLQRLRQDVNAIAQVTSQLMQTEQNNSSQLQQLQQREIMASQGLQRIHQMVNSLAQEINQVSSIAQQIASQVSGQFGFGQYGYGYVPTQYTPQYYTPQYYTPQYTGYTGYTGYQFTGYTPTQQIAQQPAGWASTAMLTQPFTTGGYNVNLFPREGMREGFSEQQPYASYAHNLGLTSGMFGQQAYYVPNYIPPSTVINWR